ncbi:baseplate J/gp47 family protein [Flavobacterium sp.]|uniref:baseplate J/gp47 family protein n=1 Tax=Flavobacterium sp. TaxID=239 RepID=UPI00286B7B8A|nr:baseplate J/gp47 family protein [Flavobacterium sp.]
MANCNGILSIHEGMGTAQNDRTAAALQPDFFLLEERNEQDFIRFVQKLSAQVKFYNQSDVAEGDWAEFFARESTAILIAISSWSVELMQDSFESRKNEVLTLVDLNIQKEVLGGYFQKISNEYKGLLGKINLLDDEIIEKENLRSTAYLITEQLQAIITNINTATNMEAFLKSPGFGRLVQQLFGLLLSWKSFSNSAIAYQLNHYAGHTPHFTLFLTFLKLLKNAKESLNGFTKKHLDFYYKDILRTQNQNARPDHVHLIVEPFDVKPFLIPKGTIFPAGKNSAQNEKFYASTADQPVNAIKLFAFESIHSDGARYKSDLFQLNAKGKGFDVFTSNKTVYNEALMIASPLLFLQSGKRAIKLRFNETNLEAADFEFYITGEEKVLKVDGKNETIEGDNYITIEILASEKKIMPFSKKLHPEFLVETQYPVLKIIPKKPDEFPSISHINLKIAVENFKSFVLDSDFGTLDTEKPFYPFGEFPKSGNGMVVNSNEFFMKKGAVATFNIPLEPHSDVEQSISDLALVSRLQNGVWTPDEETLPTISNAYPIEEYRFDTVANTANLPNGRFRIKLENSSFDGETFMQSFIAGSALAAPALPYKPRAKSFTFNYTVDETIQLGNMTTNNPIELYHALPYGFMKFDGDVFRFTPNETPQGSIYLGFEKSAPKDSLSFLIQLEEGTANPQLEPAEVSWDFLSNNSWTKLDTATLSDETMSLTRSGLVNLTVPDFNASNTKLPAGLFWLRLTVSNTKALSRFLGVHVQALKAVLTSYRNSDGVFMENTPKETISKSDKSIEGVKKFLQPYPSFDGRLTEADTFLYRRTSERLRHKNRAVTSWDYERIVLEEFPEVYRVKTLNHYRYDTEISNVSAGFVTLVPVAKSSKTEIISWKPILSLEKMLRIKKFLSEVASPHARINVKPPKPERVRIHFKVKYHDQPGMDTRLYTKQLTETINTYLSPWVYDTTDINFAKEIEFSSIIRLVDNQPYVDYLTDFKVEQFLLDADNNTIGGAIQNLNKIRPQTDFTLFVPDESHQIQEL